MMQRRIMALGARAESSSLANRGSEGEVDSRKSRPVVVDAWVTFGRALFSREYALPFFVVLLSGVAFSVLAQKAVTLAQPAAGGEAYGARSFALIAFALVVGIVCQSLVIRGAARLALAVARGEAFAATDLFSRGRDLWGVIQVEVVVNLVTGAYVAMMATSVAVSTSPANAVAGARIVPLLLLLAATALLAVPLSRFALVVPFIVERPGGGLRAAISASLASTASRQGAAVALLASALAVQAVVVIAVPTVFAVTEVLFVALATIFYVRVTSVSASEDAAVLPTDSDEAPISVVIGAPDPMPTSAAVSKGAAAA